VVGVVYPGEPSSPPLIRGRERLSGHSREVAVAWLKLKHPRYREGERGWETKSNLGRMLMG